MTYLLERLELLHKDNPKYAETFTQARTALDTADIFNAANYL
jgi:hypothetical protein